MTGRTSVTRAQIAEFLAGKRIAVVGPSRNEKEYSRLLFREFLKRGYDVVPVHPVATEMDGRPCARRIREIAPPPDRAILLLPRDQTEQAVLDCADAGVKQVWLHRHLAGGVSDHAAVQRAGERGITLITGYCPIMFLADVTGIHRLHGRILDWLGLAPK